MSVETFKEVLDSARAELNDEVSFSFVDSMSGNAYFIVA